MLIIESDRVSIFGEMGHGGQTDPKQAVTWPSVLRGCGSCSSRGLLREGISADTLTKPEVAPAKPRDLGRGGHSGRGTSISQVGERKQHKKTVCGTVAGTDFPDGNGDDDKVAGHNGLGG